jgi:hypothetical protein
MLLIVLFIIAVVITIAWNREHMSNSDVLTALKQYGVDTNDNKTSNSNKADLIYGPKGVLSDEPAPNLDEKSNAKAIYPNIYGPDVPLVPGKKVETQDGEGNDYDYNIDLAKAFPKADGPPQPFLTNFSSFQR